MVHQTLSATAHWLQDGTALIALQAQKCLLLAYERIDATHMHQVGSTEPTPVPRRALSTGLCVSIGTAIAATGRHQ